MPSATREDFLSPMKPPEQLAAFARRIHLPVSNLELFLYDSGISEKPALFLWHGLADEADTWQDVFATLAERFRVIAPDLPGFGRSNKSARRYTPEFFRKCMLELADVLEIRRAVWAGHSMGAMLCQTIAIDHPERVAALVLLSGGAVLPKQSSSAATILFLLPGVGEMIYTNLRKSPQAAYDTLADYYAQLDQMPAAFRDWLWLRVNQRVWDDNQRRAYFSTIRNMVFRVIMESKTRQAQLFEQKLPVLILWGEKDRVVPIENAHFLAEAIPNARLVIVPDAGHNIQQERPAVVSEAILTDELIAGGAV